MGDHEIIPFQIHTIGRCDFDFGDEPDTIFTVGEDLLKKFHISAKKELFARQLDLDQAYAVAAFPNDRSKIVIGSSSGKVDIITDFNTNKPYPIMDEKSPIYRLVISSDGNYVGIVYEAFYVAIYSVSEQKIYKLKPAHESNCLHIGFNMDSKYVCSSGCEGFINIYSTQLMKENSLDCKIKSQKISGGTRLDSPQILRFDWHPTENMIALPGSPALQLLKEKSDETWFYLTKPNIKHDEDIAAVCWNADGERLLTFSLDKKFSLWSYSNEELLLYFQCDEPIYTVKYSALDQGFGFVNHSGYYGLWRFNDGLEAAVEVEKPKESLKEIRKKSSKSKVLVEDEDDMGMIEEMLGEGKKQSESEAKEQKDEEEGDKKAPVSRLDEILKEDPKKASEPQVKEILKDKALLSDDDEKYRSFEHKKRVQRHADIIDTSAQLILYPSSTHLTKNKRFLYWNLVGSIIQSEEGAFTAIDVDFANKSFHSNIRILDQYKISMGSMNEKGIVLASKAAEVHEDEYENELIEEKKKLSHIMFRPLNSMAEKGKEWIFSLPEDEDVETVTLGNNWIAAITDIHFIRFFNFKGTQTKVLCLEKPIVCCAGYENFLALVFHDSPPFLGCQSMKVRVVDTETFNTVYEGACPISPHATLTWFGFSDSGMLVTQDSRGVMRGLPSYKQWWPLYFADETKKTSRFWLIGVHEYSFIGVIPEKDEIEPSVYQKPPIKTLKIKFPFIEEKDSEKGEEMKKYSDILKKQMILEQERFRNNSWMNYKITRGRTDNLYSYSDGILDKAGLIKSEESIEKDLVDLFQDYLVSEEYEKAIILASNLKKPKSLNVCVLLCNQLNGVQLIDKLNDMLEARRRIEQIEDVKHREKGGPNEIVIIKGNESNPILDNRKHIKKGLSSYAVPIPNQRRETEEMMDNSEYEYSGRKNESSVDDILNTLSEAVDHHNTSKVIKNRENKPSTSGLKAPLFDKDSTKSGSGEIEMERKPSLFEKFSGKNPNNPLKRKPDHPLGKEDLKKFK